jgi:feruloyl esterase
VDYPPTIVGFEANNIPGTRKWISYHPKKMFDILAAEVIKQCDPQNGLSEDIISDPRGCNFNAKTLACNMPSAAEECITADQLSTLHKLYNDWTDVNQTFVYGHL